MKALSILLLIVYLSFADTSGAGELHKGGGKHCDYTYIGDTTEGDSELIEPLGYSYTPVVLCLEGKGGSLQEGLKIFDVIWSGNINTLVLAGKVCASACAIAFMAGGDTQGTDVTRQIARGLIPGAEVKFHSPRLVGATTLSQSDIFRVPAYEAALATASRLHTLSRSTERGVSSIPEFIFGRILGTPYGEWFTLETIGDAVISGVDIVLENPVSIKSDQHLKNICDNFMASRPWTDWPIGVHPQSEAYFTYVQEASKNEFEKKVPAFIFEDEYYKFFVGNVYHSGSKYGYVACILSLNKNFDPESHYGSPIYTSHRYTKFEVAPVFIDNTQSSSRNFGLKADALQEIDTIAVPSWFSLDYKIRLDQLN